MPLECRKIAGGECGFAAAAKQRKRVGRLLVVAYLEVKMRAGCVTCSTYRAESLSKAKMHAGTQVCRECGKVCVPSRVSGGVLQNDISPVAMSVEAGELDGA